MAKFLRPFRRVAPRHRDDLNQPCTPHSSRERSEPAWVYRSNCCYVTVTELFQSAGTPLPHFAQRRATPHLPSSQRKQVAAYRLLRRPESLDTRRTAFSPRKTPEGARPRLSPVPIRQALPPRLRRARGRALGFVEASSFLSSRRRVTPASCSTGMPSIHTARGRVPALRRARLRRAPCSRCIRTRPRGGDVAAVKRRRIHSGLSRDRVGASWSLPQAPPPPRSRAGSDDHHSRFTAVNRDSPALTASSATPP